MQRMCFAVLFGFAATMATAGGCTVYATHPRLDGSGQLTSAAVYPIPEIMAEAIRYAHDRDGSVSNIVINLPSDTPPNVYDDVIDRLGAGRPMLVGNEPAYHVESVRVRGFDAEADVIYPKTDGHYDFLTISFHRGIVAKYDVTGTRVWRVRVEPPEPRFMPKTDLAHADAPVSDDATPQPVLATPK